MLRSKNCHPDTLLSRAKMPWLFSPIGAEKYAFVFLPHSTIPVAALKREWSWPRHVSPEEGCTEANSWKLSADLTTRDWAVTSTKFISLNFHFLTHTFFFSPSQSFLPSNMPFFPSYSKYLAWLQTVLFSLLLKETGSAQSLCRVEEVLWTNGFW